MSGPRRTKGETLPVASEQLAELKRQTENKVLVKANPNLAPTRNVIPARRGNPITAPPPPPLDDGDVSEEVVIVMSDDDDDPTPSPRRARSDTLADPMTTSKLAEAARGAPTPAATGPNRNVKRRGG